MKPARLETLTMQYRDKPLFKRFSVFLRTLEEPSKTRNQQTRSSLLAPRFKIIFRIGLVRTHLPAGSFLIQICHDIHLLCGKTYQASYEVPLHWNTKTYRLEMMSAYWLIIFGCYVRSMLRSFAASSNNHKSTSFIDNLVGSRFTR